MNTKHTAGTWHTKDGQIYPQETGKAIAVIPYFDKENGEQEANEKLIAAAPDMLNALKTINSILSDWNNTETGKGKYRNLIFYIESAINKAKID